MLQNLLRSLPNAQEREIFDDLLSTHSIKIERIVSAGQVSDPDFWYEQEWDEWVLVLEGEAELEFANGERLVLNSGVSCHLPAGCRHRVTYTSQQPQTVWLAVHWCESGSLVDTSA